MLTQQQKRGINYTLQCLIKFIINSIEILSGIVTSNFFFSLAFTAGHSQCEVNISHLNIYMSILFHSASTM